MTIRSSSRRRSALCRTERRRHLRSLGLRAPHRQQPALGPSEDEPEDFAPDKRPHFALPAEAKGSVAAPDTNCVGVSVEALKVRGTGRTDSRLPQAIVLMHGRKLGTVAATCGDSLAFASKARSGAYRRRDSRFSQCRMRDSNADTGTITVRISCR